MLLPLHISIAVASMALTAYAFFAPSISKLRITYALVVGTLISGTFLALSHPGHIVKTCFVGLAYLCLVTVGIMATHHKLAIARNHE